MSRLVTLSILMAISFSGSGINKINVSEAVMIGGIKQWINIKGLGDNNPVLLFLHGGPGSSAIGYSQKFTADLQKHFVVVQWDQRESGTTLRLNASPVPLTVALFEQDAVELINYLRSRFAQDKIYLMGHSWGGFLGMTIAARHPDLLAGYIAVSPMIYQLESERNSLALMKGKAQETQNQEEIVELAKVRIPFENGEQLFYHRKWLAIWMGQKPPPKAYVEAWSKTWLNLFNEASMVNFFVVAPEIRCPLYFFLGSKDYQTYFKITEDYFRKVKADKKELFWFTNSAHLVILTEPGKMQKIIIDQILSK